MEWSSAGDQHLYEKCVLRSIQFTELVEECIRRGLSTNSSSAYVMCLKLRLFLLKKHVPMDLEINKIEAELLTLEKKLQGYSCSIPGCDFSSKNYDNLLFHLKSLHSNLNHQFSCQLNNCCREFSSVNMLDQHIKDFHRTRKNTTVVRSRQLVENISLLTCLCTSCGHQQVHSLKELRLHLKQIHTDKKEEVSCVFRGCHFSTRKSSTLKCHFSRKHSLQLIEDLKSEVCSSSDIPYSELDALDAREMNESCFSLNDYEVREVDDAFVNEDEYVKADLTDDEIFTKALAMTFNSWANIKTIPYSTVNDIIQEVFNAYEQGVDTTRRKIRTCMMNAGVQRDTIDEIMETVYEEDPVSKAKLQLLKQSDRLKFIKSNFPYVQPYTIRLNKEARDKKPETMQFVKISDGLKIMLEDETYNFQRNLDDYLQEESVIRDVRDSLNFKNNEFFQKNKDAIPLAIFQDELEVTNPLGAGKGKSKIQCTYWTSLDIIPPYRTRIKTIQLCSLVLSKHWKKYGNKVINEEMLKDLELLETEGITVSKPYSRIVRAGLAIFVGDNLGLHQLAEMNSVFSSGFICRFCDAKYEDTCVQGKLYSGCSNEYTTTPFSREIYDECADLAVSLGRSSVDTKGIKGHCVLNRLQSFHCINQMPPCIGHDLLEGVFAYDVQFLLDYIINKEKLLTEEEFNSRLANIQLTERDAKNRPKPFKTRKRGSKYEGNAGGLRVLSKILTFILSDELELSETEEMLIKLHDLCEIAFAPSLTFHEVDNTMSDVIFEYLDMRIEAVDLLNMSQPRPKHHFLSHYPELYKNNGPLIKVWAMRMESKHTYNKNVLKSVKNFRNVALTCATRHQLAQISHYYYGLFGKSKFEVPDSSISVKEMLKKVKTTSLLKFYANCPANAVAPVQMKVFGTLYGPKKIVIMQKFSIGSLKVGVIKAMSFCDNELTFLVTSFEAKLTKFGYYVAVNMCLEDEVVKYSLLADYQSVQMIGTLNCFSFILHHFVTEASRPI